MNSNDREGILEICSDHGWVELVTDVKQAYISSLTKRSPSLPKSLEETIQKRWEEKIANASAKGLRPPHNGTLARFLGYHLYERETESHTTDWPEVFMKGANVGLDLGVMDYMHYDGVRADTHPRLWSASTTGALVFRDKKGDLYFALAVRDKSMAHVGGILVLPPGGYLDPSTFPEDISDITGSTLSSHVILNDIKREFEEELGIPKEKIKRIQPLGLVLIGDYHNSVQGKTQRFNDTCLTHVIEADTSEEELDEGFGKSTKFGGEHSEHFIVHENDLLRFLEERKRLLTPVLKVNLRHILLYSRGIIEQ